MSENTEERTKPAMKKKTTQRIKMRMRDSAVKLDGTLIEYAPDGSSFVVEFDGPVATTRFYRYGNGGTVVGDKEPVKWANSNAQSPADGTGFWGVL
jgi:hypothetical protein